MKCQNCARQYFCNKKECKFKSWIETKNYGEVRRDESTDDFKKTGKKIHSR